MDHDHVQQHCSENTNNFKACAYKSNTSSDIIVQEYLEDYIGMQSSVRYLMQRLRRTQCCYIPTSASVAHLQFVQKSAALKTVPGHTGYDWHRLPVHGTPLPLEISNSSIMWYSAGT